MAKRIMKAATPQECRDLGRGVRGFDDNAWSAIARHVVERGVYLKFSQNAEIARVLVDTGNAELIEASPFDARWGIGFAADRAMQVPKSRWGANWLGVALQYARARLRLDVVPPIPKALFEATHKARINIATLKLRQKARRTSTSSRRSESRPSET